MIIQVAQLLSDQIDRFSTLPERVQIAIKNEELVFDRSSMSVNKLTTNGIEALGEDYLYFTPFGDIIVLQKK